MDEYEITDGEVTEATEPPASMIRSFIQQINISLMLEKDVLSKIGMEVTRGYDIDKGSRSDWEQKTKTAMDLAMQVIETKTFPWNNAANVKYPLITTAAIQFSARAYPAIISGANVVKGMVTGPDEDGEKKKRAERIGHHMSYQLLNQIQEWDEDMDKLLLQLSIVGCAFRKTYYDNSLGRNCSDMVEAKYLVFNHAVPFRKLRRVTHEIPLFKNDVIERIRSGLFNEIELGMPDGEDSDEDGQFDFLEQHCWYDLDKDGYKEPYIVTVHKKTSEVVRVVARFEEEGIYLNEKGEVSKILPVDYFTKFSFMPNPDGGSYDAGLWLLLTPINETVNTTINQLLDAATKANTGGGFIGSGLRMKGGVVKFAPGEYKQLDSTGGKIADNIYHMESPAPSGTMFQLLGMLIEAGKDISSVKDILTGEQQGDQTATTTLALIEQGQKVFSAIYKRVHRALKQEYKKLYRLNKLYMQPEEYYMFQDKAQPILLQDYQGDETDVAPVSDPDLVSDTQRLTQAEALMRFIGDPLFNQMALRERYLTAIKEANPEQLLNKKADPEKEQMQEQIQQMDTAIQGLTKAEEMLKDEIRLLNVKNEIEKKADDLETDKQVFEIKKAATFDSLNREVKLHNMKKIEKTSAGQEFANTEELDAEEKARVDAITEQEKEDRRSAEMLAMTQRMSDAHNQMMQTMKDAIAAMTAPKEITRDAKGRVSGVVTVV